MVHPRTRRPWIGMFTLVILTAGFLVGGAKAALIFNIFEGPDRVTVLVSGNFNLDATLGLSGTAITVGRVFNPSSGGILLGAPVSSDYYSVNIGWTPFGTGGLTDGGGTGDRVSLFFTPAIGVPAGYMSGDPLSGVGSFEGSFAIHGMTPGSYVTTLDSGAATDTVTVNVVPEPTSVLLSALGAMALLARRRR